MFCDLDERPIGSLKGCLEHNRIKEHDDEKPLPDAKGMLAALLDDNAEVIRQIRTDLETMEKRRIKGLRDIQFLGGYDREERKSNLMIRAHLE